MPQFAEMSTLHRANTMDINRSSMADESSDPSPANRRSSTTFGRRFSRAISLIPGWGPRTNDGANSDNIDEEWTRAYLLEFNAAKNFSGMNGDIPPPVAFAKNPEFWKTMFVMGVISGFIGLAGLGFLNAVDTVT